MSKAITHWWKKYQILRAIKSDYQRESKGCPYPQGLKNEYFDRLLEAIK
jgi:hypothetical protein